MTERAEIERLLQKTGRTLEGLPEHYSAIDKLDCLLDCLAKMELGESVSERILHQSDVIELLVGALRDALTYIHQLEEKVAKRDELLAVLGVRIPEDGDPHDSGQ